MHNSVVTSPHWALRRLVASVLADRASELPGRIVDLKVSIACLHRVRMVSSCWSRS